MELAPETIIKVECLYKKFCRNLKRSLYYGALDVARDMVGLSSNRVVLRPHEFWALEDVSFEVNRGEALGIIGQNGSGKTTLLRILNGTFPPDGGQVAVRGRLGALIALGAGFHPHMTGRENIRLNGTILGMTRQEIDARFDEIVDFADIGDFLDAPVATYSSGMTVRLGFAIAIQAQPEILLADVVLAVGDLSFALKCLRKIGEYRKNGGAIILVSHGMQLVRNICPKALWLKQGKIEKYGPTQPVCDAFEQYMAGKVAGTGKDNGGTRILHDPSAQISGVQFLDAAGQERREYRVGEAMTLRIHYDCRRRVAKPIFTVGFTSMENITVVANFSNYDASEGLKPLIGKGWVDFSIVQLAIKPGNYDCTVTFVEDLLENVLDWHERSYRFAVVASNNTMYGLFQPEVRWTMGAEHAFGA
jgi:lipopolysaccharide transport system ATP-binding protein